MRKLSPFIFLAALFILSACADPNIGKPVDFYSRLNPSGTGHNRVNFDDYILEYSYSFSGDNTLIHFSGALNCKKNTHDWLVSEGKVVIHFVSEQGIIVRSHNLFSWWDEELCIEKSFQTTIPFQSDYAGVSFYLKMEMTEY